jgi:2,4-didehydro-3-deoxy-L-rhamnonate hydrolase
MRFARFGPVGHEKPCLVSPDARRWDCSALLSDWSGSALDPAHLKALDPAGLPEVPAAARWGSPIPRPGKILCIGLNYADHAAESGMPIPSEPIVFMKAPNAVVGPYDDVQIPRGATKTDWEVELAFVIGRSARYLSSPDDSAACIAGYCICNDVSERAFQLERGGQWDKGKCCDTFCPLGPWVATVDEIPDVAALGMQLAVNGIRKQNGSTATMIFNPAVIVHYLSQFMTLEVGDVVTTGTPPGVGLGQKPPQFLAVGDVMELQIDHLGQQRQRCVPA